MVNKTTILLIAVAVLLTLQISSMFRKSPVNEKAIRLDEQGKAKEQLRLKDSVYYTGQLAGRDSIIAALKQQAGQKQIQYVQLKNDYGKIRPTVDAYSSNELLRRANEWRPE